MTVHQHLGYRIIGNLINLSCHVISLTSMSQPSEDLLMKFPAVKRQHELGPRYATVWNICFQIMYSILALTCDLTTIVNKPSVISEKVRNFRHVIFAGLLYPYGMAIPIVFWPIFLYDRQLVFPKEADLLVTPAQNAMAHGGVFLYVLWELAFLPRENIKNKMGAFKYTLLCSTAYLVTLFYTKYVDKGIWPYDILTHTEGSIYFYPALLFPLFTPLFTFFAQWYIKDAIWRNRNASKAEKNM